MARERQFVLRGIDQREYRDVLGCYPTGVTVITAIGRDGGLAGMTAGSFTSVSIDPPLVAFYPAKTSSSFPAIRDADSFCVNVLTADQEYVCRDFAVPGGDKFARVGWSPTDVSGAPVLDGALAWLDCAIEQVAEAGDHLMVLARVRDLGARRGPSPLVFHRGAYGAVVSNPASARAESDILEQLRVTDNVRGRLDLLAEELGVQALVVGATGAQVVILASAGSPAAGHAAARLGDRMPLVAPVGGLFVAWRGDAVANEWIARRPSSEAEAARRRYLKQLAILRARGWSVAVEGESHEQLQKAIARRHAAQYAVEHETLLRERIFALTDQYDPPDDAVGAPADIELLSAPIFDTAGNVVVTFSLWGLPPGVRLDTVSQFAEPLVRAAAQATSDVGGQLPAGPSKVSW